MLMGILVMKPCISGEKEMHFLIIFFKLSYRIKMVIFEEKEMHTY